MRTLICVVCCFFLFNKGIKAQNSPDCRSAIPVCADAPIMGLADGGGDIDDFDPDIVRQSGCLEKGSISSANIENNTSWFVFRAGTGGQVGFDIESLPVGGVGSPTAEWDFAVYGPYDETSRQNFCTIIGDGTSEPIRCNYEVNDTNFTGIGVNPENGVPGGPFVTGSQNTYDDWLEVLPGEIYYILINNFNTNFDGDPEPYMLTFTGSSVDADQNTALDCTLRDEFLGLDITACEGDPDIILSALNSPAGPDIANVTWSVDYEDDGVIDTVLSSGPAETELTVASPNSGRYFVEIQTNFATVITDDILITFYGIPVLDEVVILDDLLNSDVHDEYKIEIVADGNGDYEYAINDGEFQDDPIFQDVPPGVNTVIINDKNGCGTSESFRFLVVGYPKFFTPNTDGYHDFWNVLGIEMLTDPVVHIFDRYGKLLKQLNANTVGWDGTFNGRPMPSSDYWFKVEYSRDDEGILVARTIRTHFTLKR